MGRTTSAATGSATKLSPLAGAELDLPGSMVHLGGDGVIRHPLPVFVIEHDRGVVLIDTGVSPDAWDKGIEATYGPTVAALWPLYTPEENHLELQLKKFGYEFKDITHVLMSHAHLDHTGGLPLFPHAELYASWAELQHAFWPMKFWMDGEGYGRADLDKTRGYSWNLLSPHQDLDLFGDGSIRFLQTPGHTPGQVTTLVQLPGQSVMIVGDAAHTQQNVAGVPCPADLDGNTAYQSMQRIKQVAAAHEATIWVMHDPEQWQQLGAPGVALT